MTKLQSTRNWAIDTLRLYGLPMPPKIPTFPPEILDTIIDYAIGPLREPFRFVDSSNFPLFIALQCLSHPTLLGDEEYARILTTYRNIRLVSRVCYSLAGPLPTKTSDSKKQTLQGVRFLEARYSSAHLPIGSSSFQVTTLMLRTSSQVQHLFSCSREFPKLCSLSLGHVVGVLELWNHLSTLSQLISLSIHGRMEHGGSLTLSSLSNFHLNNWSRERLEFKLPSLRHFSCPNVPSLNRVSENFREFLDTHLHRLETFLIPQPFNGYDRQALPSTNRDREFWDQCPNLTTVGIHISLFRTRDSCECFGSLPTHHPLRHLCINLDEGDTIGPSIHLHFSESIFIVLDRIPQIKHLSIPRFALLDTRRSESLRTMCSQRGIELTLLPSPIDCVRSYKTLPQKWYEFGLTKLVARPRG